MRWIVFLGVAVSPAFGADGGIGGPVSGFIADARGQSIRAIEGLPGAARLGAAVRLPFGVVSAAVASRGDFALALPAQGGPAALVRALRADAPETVFLDGTIAASTVLLARTGAAAALYSATGRQLQFVTGLPAAPRVLDPVEGVEAIAVALDDSGSTALIASPDGQIFAATAGASTLRAIGRLSGVSALAMLPGRDAAVAASAETGDVILIEGLGGAGAIRTLAGASSGIAAPRSLAALDAQSVGVIVGDGRLAAIAIETGAVEWIDLPGAAQNFQALDSGLFALNRPGRGPLLLLDALHGRSTWFVPPDRIPAIQRGPAKSGIGGENRPGMDRP
jgi:hypothetical protein